MAKRVKGFDVDDTDVDAEPEMESAVAVAEAVEAPEPVLGKYRVSWGEHTGVIRAANSKEAWAHFCDKIKLYPSPKTGKVEAL